MKIFRQLCLLITSSLLFAPQFIYAYDGFSTHPVITEEVAKFYNSFAERKLIPEEIEWLKQGSTREDDSPRWMNHFYDPIHKTGLTGRHLRGLAQEVGWQNIINEMPRPPISSNEWAQNEDYQQAYLSNQTWQKARQAYLAQSYQEAFFALGHTLHLIEDVSVPDHTRDDPHHGLAGESNSYYEDYAKEVTDQKKNLGIAENLIREKTQAPLFQDLNQAFDHLALFSNQNFFSEDTVQSDYFSRTNFKSLIIERRGEDSFYFKDEYPILKRSRKEEDLPTTNHPLVLQSYFSRLVPQAVLTGAGVLDLFFREVKEREQNPEISEVEEYLSQRALAKKVLQRPQELVNRQGIVWVVVDRLHKGWMGVVVFTNELKGVVRSVLLRLNPQQGQRSPQDNILGQRTQIPRFTRSALTRPPVEHLEVTTFEEVRGGDSEYEAIPVAFEEVRPLLGKNQEQGAKSEEEIDVVAFPVPPQTPLEENPLSAVSSAPPILDVAAIQQPAQSSLASPLAPSPALIFAGGSSGSPPQTDLCNEKAKQPQPQIIISEVRFEGPAGAKDEYIELYNPNASSVDLSCWSLKRLSARSGLEESSDDELLLVAKKELQGTIPAFGFFLVAHPTALYPADVRYSSGSYSIANNNTVILYDPAGVRRDIVGFGTDQTKIKDFETAPFVALPIPDTHTIQRKNLQDTNNNQLDFTLKAATPENSQSSPRRPREDFVELATIAFSSLELTFNSSTHELSIAFQEPDLSVEATNFAYELLLSTSTEFNTFRLSDFDYTGDPLPQPQLRGKTVQMKGTLATCPAEVNSYFVGLRISDKLDAENVSPRRVVGLEFPSGFCGGGSVACVPVDHSRDDYTLAKSGKVLISEVQLSSNSSTADEFVELYNPNDFPVDLREWKLMIKKKTGTEEAFIPTSKFKGVIQPFSFFLLMNAQSSICPSTKPDAVWAKSHNLAKDQVVILVNVSGAVVDQVAFGAAVDAKPFPDNPADNQTLERKARASSTAQTLRTTEQQFGNQYDTDASADDVVLQTAAQPQNTLSAAEIPPAHPTDFSYTTVGNALQVAFAAPFRQASSTQLRYDLKIINGTHVEQGGQSFNPAYVRNNWNAFPSMHALDPDLAYPQVFFDGRTQSFAADYCSIIPNSDHLHYFVLGLETLNDELLGLSEISSPTKINHQGCPPRPIRTFQITKEGNMVKLSWSATFDPDFPQQPPWQHIVYELRYTSTSAQALRDQFFAFPAVSTGRVEIVNVGCCNAALHLGYLEPGVKYYFGIRAYNVSSQAAKISYVNGQPNGPMTAVLISEASGEAFAPSSNPYLQFSWGFQGSKAPQKDKKKDPLMFTVLPLQQFSCPQRGASGIVDCAVYLYGFVDEPVGNFSGVRGNAKAAGGRSNPDTRVFLSAMPFAAFLPGASSTRPLTYMKEFAGEVFPASFLKDAKGNVFFAGGIPRESFEEMGFSDSSLMRISLGSGFIFSDGHFQQPTVLFEDFNAYPLKREEE